MLARKREQYKKASQLAAPQQGDQPSSPTASSPVAAKLPVKPLYISCLVDDVASIVHAYSIVVANPVLPDEDGLTLPVAYKLHTNFPFRYRVLPAPWGVIPPGAKITLQIYVRSPPEQREAELATKLKSSAMDGKDKFLEEQPPRKSATSIATLLKYTDRRAADTGQNAISPNPHERRSSYLNFRSDEKGAAVTGGGGGTTANRTQSDEYRSKSSTQHFLFKRLSDNLSFPRPGGGGDDTQAMASSPHAARRRALSAESASPPQGQHKGSHEDDPADDLSVVIESDIVSDIIRLEFRQVQGPEQETNGDAAAAAGTEVPILIDPAVAMIIARIAEDPHSIDATSLSHSSFRRLWDALKTRTWSDVIPLQAELISEKDYEDAMNSVKSKFVKDLEKDKRQLEMCIQQLRSQKQRLIKEGQDIEGEAQRLRALEKISADITKDELHFLSEVKMATESSFASCVERLVSAEAVRRQKCVDVEGHARSSLAEENVRAMPPPNRRRLKIEIGSQTTESGPPPPPEPSESDTKRRTVVPRWIGLLAFSSALWSVLMKDVFL